MNENVVLRFAHTDIAGTFDADARGDQFRVFTGQYWSSHEYRTAGFAYSFKINTPFPYHAELHINRIRFYYEREYYIIYDGDYFFEFPHGYQLHPQFTINVNNSKFCMAVCMSNCADQMYNYVMVVHNNFLRVKLL